MDEINEIKVSVKKHLEDNNHICPNSVSFCTTPVPPRLTSLFVKPCNLNRPLGFVNMHETIQCLNAGITAVNSSVNVVHVRLDSIGVMKCSMTGKLMNMPACTVDGGQFFRNFTCVWNS